jgi:hypothetical protein
LLAFGHLLLPQSGHRIMKARSSLRSSRHFQQQHSPAAFDLIALCWRSIMSLMAVPLLQCDAAPADLQPILTERGSSGRPAVVMATV